MNNDKIIIVSVLITTYNHEKFISEAIKGALAQKTNFDFEVVIGDDCSTDNTREICLQYQSKFHEKIKLILHEKNIGLISNYCETLSRCKGKYIAQCDGDDYWIDPYKLQKQVNYLESKKDFTMVFTDKQPRVGDKIFRRDGPEGILEVDFESILLSNMICSTTVMIRSEIINQYLIHIAFLSSQHKWLTLDYPLWLEVSLYHKIGYLPEVTSIYRIVPNSGSHPKDKLKSFKWDKCLLDIQIFYFKKRLQQKPKLEYGFKNSFHEMVFHKRKRMLLNYGWIARKHIFAILCINPFILLIILFRKMIRIMSKN